MARQLNLRTFGLKRTTGRGFFLRFRLRVCSQIQLTGTFNRAASSAGVRRSSGWMTAGVGSSLGVAAIANLKANASPSKGIRAGYLPTETFGGAGLVLQSVHSRTGSGAEYTTPG